MRAIPDVSALDLAFGNINHLPPMAEIPEEFKRMSNPYCKFVSAWFFKGCGPEQLARLSPREGVERTAALKAIQAILGSWAPAHEHKEAGAAYLLSEWFDLKEPPK